MTIQCAPASATTLIVLMSTKVTAAVFPPTVTLAPFSNPLPRFLSIAPAAEVALAGPTVLNPNGTRAS